MKLQLSDSSWKRIPFTHYKRYGSDYKPSALQKPPQSDDMPLLPSMSKALWWWFVLHYSFSLEMWPMSYTHLGSLRRSRFPWTCRKTLGEQKRKGREVGVSNCSHWRDDNSSDIIQNQWHISATSSTNNQLPCFIKCRLLLLVSAVDSGWSPHREFHSCPWAPDLHLDYMDTDFSGFFLTWLCMPFWMKEEGRVCIRNYCSAISNLLIPSTPKEESILQESSEEKDHTHPS